jgi:stage V sporulation protein R
MKQVEAYNQACQQTGELGEQSFFAEVVRKFPEFEAAFDKHEQKKDARSPDLLQFLIDHSPMLNSEENQWMKSVLQIVRTTSIYFQPQIRTKIMNEGWASYWHETLFLQDDRIRGNEIPFARVNASVTAMPRVGLNPYALGMRLFYFIEECANKGRYSRRFLSLLDADRRRRFDEGTGDGRDTIFKVRENLNDYLFVTSFLEQDFVDRHKLFVADKILDEQRMVWQWYVKSRAVEDYRNMILERLHHPPHVTVDLDKTGRDALYLVHHFEEKPLVKDYILGTLLGVEFLWGGKVMLETTEVKSVTKPDRDPAADGGASREPEAEPVIEWQRVRYTMKDRKLSKGLL